MVKLSAGDLVRIQYTGRLAGDQSIFETTDEQIAKAIGIWSTASAYGPRLVLYGRGAMIAGIEEALQTMAPGESREFHIPESKAFGQRFAELVRVMPQKEFLRHGLAPQPNLVVSIDGVPAIVKSVSSGRVMLDFNHSLAGQELIYHLQLLEVITEPAAKAKALAQVIGALAEVKVDEKKKVAVISKLLDSQKARQLQASLRSALEGWDVQIEN